MILSRLISHVKAQNWTAVALDFIIVVMGVFLGLQAQAWSVERARQKSEREYLTRLHDEVVQLAATRDAYDRIRTIIAADLVGAVHALYESPAHAMLTPAECDAIAGSAHTTVPPADLPTVTELLSTARLDQLTSTSVRTAILNFMQDAARARDLVTAVSRSGGDLGEGFPGLITHNLGPARFGVDQLWLNPDCNAAAMRTDPVFRNELQENAYMYNVYTHRAVLPVSRRLAELHATLDGAIGADHSRVADKATP